MQVAMAARRSIPFFTGSGGGGCFFECITCCDLAVVKEYAYEWTVTTSSTNVAIPKDKNRKLLENLIVVVALCFASGFQIEFEGMFECLGRKRSGGRAAPESFS